ncbi:MAG: winged helix-turn-helix domain-containing protein [Rhodocyclales bacterium]|nr:winged helix-turn-helix domain-containing protein [Rhodocyclales bacterium]
MSIPNDHAIQVFLLQLLEQSLDGKMHCNDAYWLLARQFPQLTTAELHDPYQNSLSHWANRVQFAVLRLKEQALMLHHTVAGGKGIWAISEKGRAWLATLPNADELLAELLAFKNHTRSESSSIEPNRHG